MHASRQKSEHCLCVVHQHLSVSSLLAHSMFATQARCCLDALVRSMTTYPSVQKSQCVLTAYFVSECRAGVCAWYCQLLSRALPRAFSWAAALVRPLCILCVHHWQALTGCAYIFVLLPSDPLSFHTIIGNPLSDPHDFPLSPLHPLLALAPLP